MSNYRADYSSSVFPKDNITLGDLSVAEVSLPPANSVNIGNNCTGRDILSYEERERKEMEWLIHVCADEEEEKARLGIQPRFVGLIISPSLLFTDYPRLSL